MPRFRSLSEAVRYHVEQVVNVTDVPQSLVLSVETNQAKLLDEGGSRSDSIVLRWGSSTWGVEAVTGYSFPGQLSTTDSSGGPLR
ncbi:MAG: hypothetical protein JSS66_04860 [Armatimonadetes bacterium]|nr:hypothetical protein [Armatimonadota bacterium]